MNASLTHEIIGNITLRQPSIQNSDTFIAFLSGAGVTLIVAIIGAYVNYKIAQNTVNTSVLNVNKTITASINNTDKSIQSAQEMTSKTVTASLECTIKTIEQDRFKLHVAERQEKNNKRLSAYSMLLGCKHTLFQSYATYYEIFILWQSQLYNERLVAFNNIDIDSAKLKHIFEFFTKGNQNQKVLDEGNSYVRRLFSLELDKSLDIEEGLRTKERCEELQLELAKISERFFEIIGTIKILFPSKETQNLVDEVEHSYITLMAFEKKIYKDINNLNLDLKKAINSITSPGANSIDANKMRLGWMENKEVELNDWLSITFDELEIIIEKDFNFNVKNLLEHLEAEIKKELYDK